MSQVAGCMATQLGAHKDLKGALAEDPPFCQRPHIYDGMVTH